MVPEIALKDKRIGLLAMRAGLKGKIGCHRRPQRRLVALAVRPAQPYTAISSASLVLNASSTLLMYLCPLVTVTEAALHN